MKRLCHDARGVAWMHGCAGLYRVSYPLCRSMYYDVGKGTLAAHHLDVERSRMLSVLQVLEVSKMTMMYAESLDVASWVEAALCDSLDHLLALRSLEKEEGSCAYVNILRR